MGRFSSFAAAAAAAAVVTGTVAAAQEEFNILQHIGGNGQWFPGPEVTNISSATPSGCTVELAAFFSRHGSRYPDRGAYNGWLDFQKRLQANNFSTSAPELAFLADWSPVLDHPDQQIAQISPTGYKELHEFGATWRLRYAHLYEYNTAFALWANYYASAPRVRDSARLWAQGFLGPNATALGTVYALNASDPASWMDSLGTSDLCPAYSDDEGSPFREVWAAAYLPPIQARLNALVTGFHFTADDVASVAYLCGFETQITGRRSPFCDVLTEDEVLGYEYAQDLRYWYGAGRGSPVASRTMLPVLAGLVQRLVDGPDAAYTTGANTTFVPPRVIAAFTNDGQVNQLVAASGIFDDEPDLPGNYSLAHRRFRASRVTPMRGTIAFERLSCPAAASNATAEAYVRLLLNDVVYPVAGCADGPGSSCLLSKYQAMVQAKLDAVGDFRAFCNATDEAWEREPVATFFRDDTLPYGIPIKP